MRILLGIIFAIALVIIIIYEINRTKDIISPLVLYSLFILIRYLPGILYINKWATIEIDEEGVIITFLYQTIAVICVLLGVSLSRRYRIMRRNTVLSTVYDESKLRITGYTLFVVGLLFNFYSVVRIGGVSFVLSGVQGLNAGNGNSYYRSMSFLSVIGMCLVMKGNAVAGRKAINARIVIMFLAYSFLFAIQTTRSPILEALMILFLVYHYTIKRVKFREIIKPKYIFLVFVSMMFIIIMPFFRTSTGFRGFSIGNIFEYGIKSMNSIADEFCYVGRDSFIYKNYNSENYWYGKSIINLLCAPIPSSLFSAKPHVDDGIYLANATIGRFISPPSNQYIWYNSYPISASGTLYINFGVVGLIVGSILLGIVYGSIYKLLKNSNHNVVIVIIYQLVLYQYEISVLSTVQTLMPMLITIIVSKLFLRWKLAKAEY